MCSYYYLTYQRHLIRLIILCYFHVWRTRFASEELFCSGFILICPADLGLSKLRIQNHQLSPVYTSNFYMALFMWQFLFARVDDEK